MLQQLEICKFIKFIIYYLNCRFATVICCCVKTVQFNKFVTCTKQDGNNPIQFKWRDASA